MFKLTDVSFIRFIFFLLERSRGLLAKFTRLLSARRFSLLDFIRSADSRFLTTHRRCSIPATKTLVKPQKTTCHHSFWTSGLLLSALRAGCSSWCFFFWVPKKFPFSKDRNLKERIKTLISLTCTEGIFQTLCKGLYDFTENLEATSKF
jgi:hypothetical protein